MITGEDFLDQYLTDEQFPKRDYLNEHKNDPFLSLDEKSYIHRKLNPANLKKKNSVKHQIYQNKMATMQTYRLSEIFVLTGNKNALWAPHRNEHLLVPLPEDYPHCKFGKGKDIVMGNIDSALRFGGHFNSKDVCLYMFWVESSPRTLYRSKRH